MNINKRILFCFIALLVVGSVSLYMVYHSPKYQEQEQMRHVQTVHEKNTRLPYTYLNNVIAQSRAACSVYYKSLKSGEVFYNFSGKMPAGDLIRPYVAAAVLHEVDTGTLAMNTVYILEEADRKPDSPVLAKVPEGSELTLQNLVEDMLLENDTTALYKLVDIAGLDTINDWLHEKGFVDTIMGTYDLPKEDGAEEQRNLKEKPQFSYTSVNDTVNLFSSLSGGTCVNSKADAYLLTLLAKEPRHNLLGALLPKDVKIAGQESSRGAVLGTGGIVEGKEKYILVVMVDKAIRPAETRKTINQISSIIFNTVSDKEVF